MRIDIQILDPRLAEYTPEFATDGAAAMDLRAAIDAPIIVKPGEAILIPTGFAMAVPEGYAAMLLPRSGLGHKKGLVLGNLVGLLDSDYRGQVMVSAWNRNFQDIGHAQNGQYDLGVHVIQPWDRIAQMIVVPVARWSWHVTDSLPGTDRGAGGFGHTGVN